MSSDSAMRSAEIEVLAVQRRRRYSAEEKQRLVEETLQPGMNVSLVVALSSKQSSAEGRMVPVGPRRLDNNTPQVRATGFAYAPASNALPARVLTRDHATVVHQLPCV